MSKIQFHNQKFLGFNWLKNATADGGALKEVIKNKKPNEIILNHVSKKYEKVKELRMWGSCTPEALLPLITSNNYLYEVITSYPYKVYFDIDEEIEPDKPTELDELFELLEIEPIEKNINDYLKPHIRVINELFPNGDIAISGSLSASKASFHITLNNYLIRSDIDREVVKIIVETLKWDNKVYTKNRNMKLINQSKPDGRIQDLLVNNDLKKHIITAFFNNCSDIKPIPTFENTQKINEDLPITNTIKIAVLSERIKQTPFNIGSLPSRVVKKLNDDFDLLNASPKDLLDILPLIDADNHQYTSQCCRFCYYNNISFDDFIIWRRQKREYPTLVTKWGNFWENVKKFPIFTMDSMRYLILSFYPSLLHDKAFRDYKKLFTQTDIAIKTVKVNTLSQKVFNTNKRTNNKYIILNTQMGSGKTSQTIDYLKIESEKTFIWITPLISLAQNTKFRLDEKEIKCKLYKDCKNAEEKEALDKERSLLICINSLKYIKTKQYNIVVIDEIETLLNKWFNNKTLDTVKYNCWDNFIRILRSADKVIFLDAFTSKLTTDFIKIVEFDRYKPIIVEREIETSKRQVQFMVHYSTWLNDIIENLKKNKKIFIFYPFKNAQVTKHLPSMEELAIIISKETGKTGKYYHGEVSQLDTLDLYNVNQSWADLNFIITNTKITVGINYENTDFDLVYLGVAGMNSARDLLQVSYRCRYLKDELIKVCFIDRYNSNLDFKNDKELLKSPECTFCPVYESLVKNILIEKYAPLQESFIFLCRKANYTIINSNDFIDEALKNKFKQLLKDNSIIYSYNSIEDIPIDDFENYQNSLYSNSATQMMQIQMRKYYFDLLFIQTIEDRIEENGNVSVVVKSLKDDPQLISFKNKAWNEKYFDFITATGVINSDIITSQSNFKDIFTSLKPYFDNEIMPTEKGLTDIMINKVKLSPELLTKIFDNFHFKKITKTSATHLILKSIYNNFFNKFIIKIHYDEQKRPKIKINQECVQMFNYTSKYAKKNKFINNEPIEEIEE